MTVGTSTRIGRQRVNRGTRKEMKTHASVIQHFKGCVCCPVFITHTYTSGTYKEDRGFGLLGAEVTSDGR